MNTNLIKETAIEGLQVSHIFKTDNTEVILVSLEKEKTFPKHSSPKDAFLLVLEGYINFYIENKIIALEGNEIYTFKKDVEHYVKAQEDSKFLIIR